MEEETVTSYADKITLFSNVTNVLPISNGIENQLSNVFDCFSNNYLQENRDKLNLLRTPKEETSIKCDGSIIKKTALPKNY